MYPVEKHEVLLIDDKYIGWHDKVAQNANLGMGLKLTDLKNGCCQIIFP